MGKALCISIMWTQMPEQSSEQEDRSVCACIRLTSLERSANSSRWMLINSVGALQKRHAGD